MKSGGEIANSSVSSTQNCGLLTGRWCLRRADRAATALLTSSSHSHKYIKQLLALLPCVPHGCSSCRASPVLCGDGAIHSTEKAGKLHFPVLFCLLPPRKGGSQMFCRVVYQEFSACFQFQQSSKEEDTPLNVLHDNKLGKHHFWMQLMGDWLLPVPSGRLIWDYQMMCVVFNALLDFLLGKSCVCQPDRVFYFGIKLVLAPSANCLL